jgi:2-polyprenyl-6-methoxyphenol hydroxylase-like FAD-dependent oxidoreductase
MAARRALVIGGSLGGLFAALLLRSAGWSVVVFERNPEDLTGRGAGLSTHPQLIDVLRRVGVDFGESMGVKLDTFIFLDRTGNTYLEAKTVRTMSSWGRLYRSLRDLLPPHSYRLGMSLRHVEQDTAGVCAIFIDGSRIDADLLVGADGVRSTVREQFLPQVTPNYAGYVAWRAMLDESEIPPAIRAEVFERCFWPILFRGATTRRRSDAAPTTSSGIARPPPLSWPIFASTRRANITAPRFRHR